MPELVNLQTHIDSRGNLTVIEKILPFDIKRIFYIYGVDHSERGGHRHRATVQFAVCLKGSCNIFCHDGVNQKNFLLDSPAKGLLLFPEDWHTMSEFTEDAILMVIASEHYDYADYIFEPY